MVKSTNLMHRDQFNTISSILSEHKALDECFITGSIEKVYNASSEPDKEKSDNAI